MNPLEVLMQVIARVLNRNIRESTPARDLVARLEGRLIAIRVRDTALAGYFEITDGAIELRPEHEGEPDVAITGSLLTLALMAGEDSIRDGSLDLAGDAGTAQRFQKLLEYARPDLEEELSAFIGDTAAHGLGELARGFARWARQSRSIMGNNIREYLQEESGEVPSRYEVERFAKEVNRLRDDVDRLAARINRLGSAAR